MNPTTVTNWAATQGFLPHGICFQWSPELLTLMVVSNLAIAIAYFTIPLALLTFLDRRRDIKFSWLFMLFAAFIFCCATGHIMHVVTIWYPAYWVQGWIDAATAFVSLLTAILLWPMVLKASHVVVPVAVSTEVEDLKAKIVALEAELALKN